MAGRTGVTTAVCMRRICALGGGLGRAGRLDKVTVTYTGYLINGVTSGSFVKPLTGFFNDLATVASCVRASIILFMISVLGLTLEDVAAEANL